MKITKLCNNVILRGVMHFLREYVEEDPLARPVLLAAVTSVFILGYIFMRNAVAVGAPEGHLGVISTTHEGRLCARRGGYELSLPAV